MKKFLSIILSILMVVTMLPMSVLPASASTATGGCDGSHSGYTAISGRTTINKAGNYYLTGDVSANGAYYPLKIYCSGTVTLCLNGYDIYQAGTASVVVDIVATGGDLTVNLCDCKGTGEIYRNNRSYMGIYLEGDSSNGYYATLNMYGGTIRNSTSGVCEYPNTIFNMYGGTIKNSLYYGVVQDSSAGKVNIYGGTITGNPEGIRVCSADGVTLTGSPVIKDNTKGDLYIRIKNSTVIAENLSVSSPITIAQDSAAAGDYAVVKVDSADMINSFKYINDTKTLVYVDGQIYSHGDSHTFKDATCIAPKTCIACGVTEGDIDATAHSWANLDGICANGCGATCAHENQTGLACEICGADIHVCSNYNNGFCTECDAYEPAELKDGYYQIKNGGNLFWYANYINTVDRTANAVLTANIDLENRPWTPIGSTGENSNNFRGIFDGQNYTIRGLYAEGGRAGLGFFGEVRTGTVKNFTIYGEVVVNTEVDYVGGVIGSVCGVNGENDLERNGAIIQNIKSYVNLTAKAHGVGMIGGFVGYANHQSLIENCSWYGTFDAGEYRVDSGAGGFIGKIRENTSEVTIRNCGAYGTIKTNYAKNSYNNTPTIYMGGFLSFSNTNAQTTLENCLFAGKFERGENLTDEALLGAFGTLRSVNAIKNCYYLGDDGLEAVHSDSSLKPGSDNVEITKVTGEELKSGKIANQLGEYWEQVEDYPRPKDTGSHSHSYTYTDNGDGTHDKECLVCDYVEVDNEAHSGGTATCTEQAKCERCGTSYGELDPDNHDFGSGNTCICGAEIAFTGIVVDDENSDEYRYDETRKTYTIIIPADEVGGIGYLSYDIIGTNLTLIEDTNTLLKVQHENEDGLTSAPDDLLVDVLQDNGYFGWSVLGYGDGEWEKLLYSNDGGMTWTTYTFEVKQAYSITVNASQNGTVTANEYAIEGDNIALNVSPAEGYMLDTLSVTDASGNSVDVENNAFTMPASAVTVTATFAVCDHKDGRHETATDNGDGTHDATYSCCGATVTEGHTGGEATCTDKAVCDLCGASYGEVNAHDWSNKDGICTNCGEVCPHEKYTNSVCDKCGYACPHDSYTNGFCTECDAYEPAELNENGYYEIGNAGQLYWFADKAKNDRTNYGSANAILTQNIVVNENVLTADGKLNGFGSDFRAWIPPYAYKGTFDGAGKTVSGLYFKDTEERDVGFIGYLYGGTVKNLTVKDSYFNAYSAVGGIVGSVIEGTVTDCFSSATVIAGSLGYAGGIAGENGAGLVERCANSGFVTSGYEAGGIVGYNHNYYDDPDPAIIRHCYNIGSVSGYTVGGIVGNATQQMGSSVEIDSCWAACELNGTNSVGGLIGFASGSTIRCCSYDKTVFTGNPVGKKTSCNTLDSGFKSTEEFASGAAAYLLNGKSSGGFWRQTIGTDAYPGFSGDKVYYGYISCADNAKKVYTNDATATEVKPAHNWSNNDGICANGCGYECTHVSYTGGVCDNCNYECPHAWGEGVLTRPVHDTVLGSKDGYYTYTCTVCDYEKKETVKSADYSAYEAVSEEINALLQSDELTDAAKQAIYSAANECGLPSNDLTESEQNIVDDLVAELEKIVADAEEKIASGEYVKADYTEIDEAIDDIEEKLASENVTDEGKAELEEIKKQLEEMKADENTSAADVAELEKALEDYEEELDKGIEDGTLVEVDVDAITDDVNKKWAEKLEAEGLLDEYEDFINNQKATDEAMATVDEINDFANSLEGTVAENAENIAKLNEMLDSLLESWENCLRGTHNFKDYEITSPAKCEVNAKETSTCWFCGETDEREVEGTALEHSFTKYEETEAPKCGVAGKEVAYCDNGCQTTDERETPALEHIFLDYVSNGDATCTADGTKTASCLNGCGTTDTVADEGSMLDHTDEDGDKLCDDCGEEVYDRCDICGGKAHGDDKIQLVFCMIITIIRFVTAILKSIN